MNRRDLDQCTHETFGKFFATPEQIARHNTEIRQVWDAYGQDRPIRVPVTGGGVSWKHLVHADPAKSFRTFYTDAETMMRWQATSAMLTANIPACDMVREEPARFRAGLDFWPFSDEAYWGAEVVWLDRQQPKLRRLYENERVPVEAIKIPDPFTGNFMAHISAIYDQMIRLTGQLVVFGRPFDPAINVWGLCTTYGVFSTALQLRGTDLFLDVADDPAYVTALVQRMAEGYVRRRAAWASRHPDPLPPPAIAYDHGIDQLSLADYERCLVPVYRGLKTMLEATAYDQSIEHCGHGEHIIRYKHRQFGINDFHNLNAAFLNLERLRHDLGPEVRLGVTISPEVVHSGPPARIHAAVRDLLTPALKGKGRLYITMCAHDYPEAPFEHIVAFYEAAKEYGRY